MIDLFGRKRITELEGRLEDMQQTWARDVAVFREERTKLRAACGAAETCEKEQREQKHAAWKHVIETRAELDQTRSLLAKALQSAGREILAREFAGEPMSNLTAEGIVRAFALADAWIAAREGVA